MYTKTIDEFYEDKDVIDKMFHSELDKRIKEALNKFNLITEELYSLVENNWIKIENKKVYYNNEFNLLIPDFKKFRPATNRIDEEYKENKSAFLFEGFKGELIRYNDAKKIFFQDKKSPFINDYMRIICKKEEKVIGIKASISDEIVEENFNIINSFLTGSHLFGSIGSAIGNNINNNVVSINNSNKIDNKGYIIPVLIVEKDLTYLKLFLKYNLIAEEFSLSAKQLFKEAQLLLDKGLIEIDERDNFFATFKLKNLILSGECTNINSISLKKEDILSHLNKNNERLKERVAKLLYCEKIRADIEPYDTKIIEDINRGHWDIWSEDKDINKVKIKIEHSLVARNPLADVKNGALVGIDFGTKSTIVVVQEDSERIMPLRVGTGRFSKSIKDKDFENPTVIEFRDIENFIKQYDKKDGRPDTLWEDVTVSYTAFNNMVSSESSNYYSFIDNLKQWAGNRNINLKIKDSKKHCEKIIPDFLDIGIGDLNPIELYAYYIGLYVNNMYNGIYLEYILSFPVTYEKAVVKKIIDSFKKGIKKSIPCEVLNDSECMKKFKVYEGASEPAAYAVCALQEYNFEPENDEKVFYGIFDFGGGTTDFDFGIWSEADASERRYDYVIKHFGAGGDRHLGGESLLEMLAFEVFKYNKNDLLQKQIQFTLPGGCEKFAGSEVLISKSQEAKLNIKQLKEKLRPFWEHNKDYLKQYENGIIKVNLFDKNGQHKMNVELNIDIEQLEKLLEKRIEKGINNFFEALKLTFTLDDMKKAQKIVIFLAGNSSKSEIVKTIFDKYIKDISKELGNNTDYFSIYPPLGTNEAVKIQKQNGVKVINDEQRPTGKTGVAYGLLQCRKGSRIKIINEIEEEKEIKFNYYIGYNKKGKFKVLINRDVEYGKWIDFIDASEDVFEIYYSNLPEVTTNKLLIDNVDVKKIRISTGIEDERADVYLRIVSPYEIEYTVAYKDEIDKDKYLTEVRKINLK